MIPPVFATLPSDSVLPALIFLAETCVLTIATIRTIAIARGKRIPAAILGFFEVSIWLFAVGQVMQNLNHFGCAIAFAAGFSLGNYLGVLIEQWLAIGNLKVQVTTKRDAGELIQDLHVAGYGATRMEGEGASGPVKLIMTVVRRKDLVDVISLIQQFDPNAFYSVHDLQSSTERSLPWRPERSAIPSPIARIIRALFPRHTRTGAVSG